MVQKKSKLKGQHSTEKKLGKKEKATEKSTSFVHSILLLSERDLEAKTRAE